MKLPQDIEGIYREGRSDAFASTHGVEPLWLRDKIRGAGKWLWKRKKKAACIAKCALAGGGWAGRARCAARCVF